MNIEEIEDIWKIKHPGIVPGTILSRTLLPEAGIGWIIGIGPLQRTKTFFMSPTIEGCLTQAKKFVINEENQ